MTRLTKPVTRLVDVPGHGAMNVTLTAQGITFRPYKARTAFLLPYGVGIVRAATLAADARRKERSGKRKRKVKRGAL